MSRPTKTGLEYFPTWTPQRRTSQNFFNKQIKIIYNSLRNSSSGFIKREDVRLFIFNRDNNACSICGNKENLQVDHIISVYRCAIGELPISELNLMHNLQTLCGKCNTSKLP